MSTSKKRSIRKEDDEETGNWECTVCTFINKHEAFKCEMCDTRKGTSTRKPRLNQNVVQQQQIVQDFVVEQSRSAITATTSAPSTRRRAARALSPSGSLSSSRGGDSPRSSPGSPPPPRPLPTLTGVDRESARTLAVTVRGLTVIITDFKALPPPPSAPSAQSSSISLDGQ